jgi:hypothetical protein
VKARSRSVIADVLAGDVDDREVDVVGEGGAVARQERVGGLGREGTVLGCVKSRAETLDNAVNVVVFRVDQDAADRKGEEGLRRADDGSDSGGGRGGHGVSP